MNVLTLVRHGEAEGNHEHRFIGQADVPLSAAGRDQAQRVGRRLFGAGVEAIVSSDLQRAVDTARPLAELTGLPIRTDPRLREIANGEWTNLLATEIEAGWPDLWAPYQSGEDVARPGGERWSAVRERVVAALLDLDPDVNTVVFSHGGPTLAAALWAVAAPAPGNIFRGPLAPVSNASITTLSLQPRRLIALNDTGHLDTDGPLVDLPIWDRPHALDE